MNWSTTQPTTSKHNRSKVDLRQRKKGRKRSMSGEDHATGKKEGGMVVIGGEGTRQGGTDYIPATEKPGQRNQEFSSRLCSKTLPKTKKHTKTKETGKPIYIKKAGSQTSTKQTSPSNNWSFEAFYQ